jgi:hypothetical protein
VVKDIVDAFTGSAADVEVSNIAFDHPETRQRFAASEYFVQIGAVAGGEVVDADNCLSEGEELVKQVGTDEARYTGYQPDFRGRREFFAYA